MEDNTEETQRKYVINDASGFPWGYDDLPRYTPPLWNRIDYAVSGFIYEFGRDFPWVLIAFSVTGWLAFLTVVILLALK
jgi:hypothetical protein